MAQRIVVFGASGYTGRLVAERLAAQGAVPVLAGRSEERLRPLADSLGAEWRVADAGRPSTVFALVQEGDVLVSTVGPFVRWGEPAVRAAIARRAVYVDSTGEPRFIRRVFEELGPPAARAGAALLPALGYDYAPGALAGGLALREAGEAAVRVDVGYYALGTRGVSAGTRESALGIALDPSFAFRDGAVRSARSADRLRSFTVAGRERPAVSVGAAEHFALPAAFPSLREVNVHLGWFGPLSRPLQAASLAGSLAGRLPGVRAALGAVGGRLLSMAPAPAAGTTPGGRSWIAAEALGADGEKLAEVHLSGTDPYDLTAGLLAWAARRAAGAGVDGTGALGPVAAFGLDALEAGCAEAGLRRVPA